MFVILFVEELADGEWKPFSSSVVMIITELGISDSSLNLTYCFYAKKKKIGVKDRSPYPSFPYSFTMFNLHSSCMLATRKLSFLDSKLYA